MKLGPNSTQRSMEHLVYEIMMFHGVASKLLFGVQDQFEKNVLVESFAIHNRNLFDFFYKVRKLDTDMVVSDFNIKKKHFLTNRTPKAVLENSTKKTDKQIVHLTYNRINYNRLNKGWNIEKIYKDMNKTIEAFYRSVGVKEREWIIKLYEKYGLNVYNLKS